MLSPAGGRAGQRRQHIGRKRKRDQRSALDAEHGIPHHGKGRHCSDHRAKSDQARHAHGGKHGRVRAGVDRLADGRQPAMIDQQHHQDRGCERCHD